MGRDFSVIGHALAAPVRSNILNMLMDGSSRPASELATAAGVTPPTASEHLALLTDTGLITCTPHGRRRFYSLANATVAETLEQLGGLCPPTPTVGYTRSREADRLAQARTCYDHLAGRLGVALTEAMVSQDWLAADDLALAPLGATQLTRVGVDIETASSASRPLTRSCADWTERKVHLAGSLGAQLATLFLDRGWVLRHGTSRGLQITEAGHSALRDHWGISPGAINRD